MKNLVIIGTSETAERVFFFCQYYSLYNVIGFAVDEKYKTKDEFHNLPVWSIEDLSNHFDKKMTIFLSHYFGII